MNNLNNLNTLNYFSKQPIDSIYYAGTGASLDLNFARNKSLMDRISGNNLVTFTRASSGTYVGSDGLLKTATTNLQRHSEDFTQGLTPDNATLTANQGTAPNGTITADQFLETTTNGLHSQEIADHVFIAGAAYTFSCYAKSIGGRNFAPGFPTLFSSARFGFFNLSGSGSVINTDAGVTALIQAVGDGWYRCSITSTCVTGGGARVGVFIASGTSISYVGDAAKGLLLWGAQLEQSATVGEYISTTSTINSAPRFDHNPTTGESLGLLVEEQRTNLLLRSEEFDSASWIGIGSIISANAIASPSGAVTSDLLRENASTSIHEIYQVGTSGASTYTLSVFFKNGSGTRHLNLGASRGSSDWISCRFNPVNGTASAVSIEGNSFTSASAQIVSRGDGWYRGILTFTSAGSFSIQTALSSSSAAPASGSFGVETYQGDNSSGIYLWGAQLEAGAFPTSYIPTTTATATRAADVASITGSNFSSWYRQDEGTVYCSFSRSALISSTGFANLWAISDNTASERFLAYNTGSSQTIDTVITNGNVNQGLLIPPGVITANSTQAHSFTYKANDFAATLNAGAVEVDVSGNCPTVSRLYVRANHAGAGQFSGTIRRLTYFPQRLSNANLQRITQ